MNVTHGVGREIEREGGRERQTDREIGERERQR